MVTSTLNYDYINLITPIKIFHCTRPYITKHFWGTHSPGESSDRCSSLLKYGINFSFQNSLPLLDSVLQNILWGTHLLRENSDKHSNLITVLKSFIVQDYV